MWKSRTDGAERKLGQDDLSEYLRAKEPGKAELAGIWRAAIGLQKVDGLTPSAYLVETARRNIEGEITIAEAGKIIGEYYKSKAVRAEAAKTRTDEADIVSQRITEILAEPTFSFSPEQLVSIHRRLFDGIFKHAGTIRDYNITKNEWVLKGDTVLVRANYSNIPKGIEETTEYLERFFRNALMGEENKLQSRYLLVGGWKGDSTPTSKDGTPTSKSPAPTSNTVIPAASKTLVLSRAVRLLLDVLDGEMSRAKVMKAIGIKDRATFTDYYLSPALKLGLVEMTQPNSPRSPTQKYRLTPKGLAAKGGRK